MKSPSIFAVVGAIIEHGIESPPVDPHAPCCIRCHQPMFLSKKFDPTEDDMYICGNVVCGLEDYFQVPVKV